MKKKKKIKDEFSEICVKYGFIENDILNEKDEMVV